MASQKVGTTPIKKGQSVSWKWGGSRAVGKVETISRKTTTRKIKGKTIKRKGSDDNPALSIKQQHGGRVLKLASEVKKR